MPLGLQPQDGGGGAARPESVEFVALSGNTEAQVEGIEVLAYDMQTTDGQQAPQQKVDEGYTWTTRVGPEPTEIRLSGWATTTTYATLVGLRDAREPIAMEAGARSLSSAVVTSIEATATGETVYAYDVQLTINEVQQLSLGTGSTVQAFPVTGPQSSSPSDDGAPPTRRRGPIQRT